MSAFTRPRRSPARSTPAGWAAPWPARRCPWRRGRRANRSRIRRLQHSRKGGLNMAVRELEVTQLPQAGDPPAGGLAALRERLFGPFRRGAPPQPRPATGFYTDTTVCIGCKACEVACKQWNQLPADGFNWTGNSYDNTAELSATSWRHVKFIEQFTPDGAGPGRSGEPSRSGD